MEESSPKPLMSAALTVEDGNDKFDNTPARLFEDVLELDAEGFCRRIKLSDIVAVSAEHYKITVQMQDRTLVFSMLGHLYEDFAKRFVRACNEVFFAESLMSEKVHYETPGQYIAPGGEPEPAIFRICETALTVLPDAHALVRIPFCMVEEAKAQPYRSTITDKRAREYVLQKLGRETDRFLKEYDNRVAELTRLTKQRFEEIAPVSDALARLMMEGQLVPIDRIRSGSEGFADALENKLNELIPDEYGYIKEVCGDVAVGLKRGLMGELTGESLMILGCVKNKERVVLESLGASAATYVFRTEGEDFAQFLPAFNESMLAVNFRREPIYLSDEALKDEKYAAYRYALMRCPPLAGLRTRFIGRAAHSGYDAWKRALGKYLDET